MLSEHRAYVSLARDASPLLKALIEEHLNLYVSLAGPSLKPKHHFLTHYAMIFDQCGPLINMSSMRYESKHRDITQAAGPNMSRVNIAQSLAIKHQLNMCYRLMSNETILPKTIVGPGHIFLFNESIPYFHLLAPDLREKGKSFSANWIEYKGTVFKPGMVIVVGTEKLCPVFAEIVLIFNEESDDPVFVCTYLENIGLCEHVLGYEIEKTDDYVVIRCQELVDPLPISYYTMANGERYVILRYSL